MVGLLKNGGLYGLKILELCGLSTDEKPTDRIDMVMLTDFYCNIKMCLKFNILN